MRIESHIEKSFPDQVRNTVEERALSKLDRFQEQIQEVSIALRDLNGPKGFDHRTVISVLHDLPGRNAECFTSCDIERIRTDQADGVAIELVFDEAYRRQVAVDFTR